MKRWGQIDKQLEKHLNLTYCLNITLKAHEKNLFWYITAHIINEMTSPNDSLKPKLTATIFSTSDPFLLIIHEKDQFWYIATDMEYEIFKWAPQNNSIELKWAENEPVFFLILPPFYS